MRSQIVLLLAAMIQDRALTFVKELNVDGFNPFDGWLWRWKERNHINLKTVSREEMVDGW